MTQRDQIAVDAAAADYVSKQLGIGPGAFDPYPLTARTREAGEDLWAGFSAGANGRTADEVIHERLGLGTHESGTRDDASRRRSDDIRTGFQAGTEWARSHPG